MISLPLQITDTAATDVLKALCLGAKAVGLGRPFLYAQSVSQVLIANIAEAYSPFQAYGATGVVKIVRILEREIILGMRLLGARKVEDLVPEMVHFTQLLRYFTC